MDGHLPRASNTTLSISAPARADHKATVSGSIPDAVAMVASEMVNPQPRPVNSRITSSQRDFGDWIDGADMTRKAF